MISPPQKKGEHMHSAKHNRILKENARVYSSVQMASLAEKSIKFRGLSGRLKVTVSRRGSEVFLTRTVPCPQQR